MNKILPFLYILLLPSCNRKDDKYEFISNSSEISVRDIFFIKTGIDIFIDVNGDINITEWNLPSGDRTISYKTKNDLLAQKIDIILYSIAEKQECNDEYNNDYSGPIVSIKVLTDNFSYECTSNTANGNTPEGGEFRDLHLLIYKEIKKLRENRVEIVPFVLSTRRGTEGPPPPERPK